MAALPLMPGGGIVVGLDFDATVAWPGYDWMGVAKAGARVLRPLPRPRPRPAEGIRVNLVAAGPLKTMAAKSHPRLREVRGRLGAACAARLGHRRRRARRPRLRGAAVRLVPRHDRGDRARRRRRARGRRLNAIRVFLAKPPVGPDTASHGRFCGASRLPRPTNSRSPACARLTPSGSRSCPGSGMSSSRAACRTTRSCTGCTWCSNPGARRTCLLCSPTSPYTPRRAPWPAGCAAPGPG